MDKVGSSPTGGSSLRGVSMVTNCVVCGRIVKLFENGWSHIHSANSFCIPELGCGSPRAIPDLCPRIGTAF